MRHTRTLDGFVVGDVVFTGYLSAPAAIKYAGVVGVIPHYIKVVEVSDDLSIKDIKELIDQSEPTSLYALDLAKEVATLEEMVVAAPGIPTKALTRTFLEHLDIQENAA
jgi:hypothetical protein